MKVGHLDETDQWWNTISATALTRGNAATLSASLVSALLSREFDANQALRLSAGTT